MHVKQNYQFSDTLLMLTNLHWGSRLSSVHKKLSSTIFREWPIKQRFEMLNPTPSHRLTLKRACLLQVFAKQRWVSRRDQPPGNSQTCIEGNLPASRKALWLVSSNWEAREAGTPNSLGKNSKAGFFLFWGFLRPHDFYGNTRTLKLSEQFWMSTGI